MSDSKSSGGNIGFLGILTLLFIALKLTGQIEWSWWWVLSPFWIPLMVCVVLFFLVVIAELAKR